VKSRYWSKILFSISLFGVLALQQGTQAQVSVGATRPLRRLAAQSGKFVPGEVIVTYKDSVSSSDVAASMATVRSNKLRQVTPKMVKLNVAGDVDLDTAIDDLSKDPNIESVQPNFIYHALSLPNDPRLATSTATNAGLSAAWDRITDCSAVTVAVVDSGVNYAHEDLASNMWSGGAMYPNHGWDFVSNDNDPKDENGHGTHVAGIIGAVGNNAIGSSGVCWRASIMAVRALDETGSGTTADIAAALNFAGNNGAKVVNMSLGTTENDSAIRSAITSLNSKGVVVIVAAGNESNDVDTGTPSYPCSYSLPNLVCVAAITSSNTLASFSNTGATSVDVAAPGVNIESSYAGTETFTNLSFASSGVLNWSTSGSGWGYRNVNVTSGNTPMLVNPATYDGSVARYANNMTAQVWRTLNLAGVDVAWFETDGFLDIAANDFFSVASKSTGGNPFDTGGSSLDSIEDFSSGAEGFLVTYPLKDCRTTMCSIGFQMTTDSSGTDFGAGIYHVSVTTLSFNNATYERLDGTSMATPFVSGIATMLFAYNPSYTAADVVASIKGGGTSLAALSGKTSTGKAASADGSLKFIVPPTGVVATVE
jgi:thermitase